jgi:hypothetical protein
MELAIYLYRLSEIPEPAAAFQECVRDVWTAWRARSFSMYLRYDAVLAALQIV